MPKKGMGCWCPVEKKSNIITFVVVLDIIAIMLMLYLTIKDGTNWIFYLPSTILIVGSILVLYDRYIR